MKRTRDDAFECATTTTTTTTTTGERHHRRYKKSRATIQKYIQLLLHHYVGERGLSQRIKVTLNAAAGRERSSTSQSTQQSTQQLQG